MEEQILIWQLDAELGIPAVIRVGEYNFTKWSKANIRNGTVNKHVKIIS